MQPASELPSGSSTSSSARKWGPIAAIVAVVVVIGGLVIATRGGDDTATTDTTAAPTSTAPPTSASGETSSSGPAQITFPLSWSRAKEQGITVDWGKRCDTTTGRVAVPDFFAPECYAPFTGDNGGATAQGITSDTIKVVYYQGQEDDPIINYISDAVKVDDTNAQSFETAQGFVKYYETYYETYGRKVDLIQFTGSGLANDAVAARADAVKIAKEIQPFAVFGGPALTNAFADELAANKVMCLGCTPGQPDEFYEQRAPYVWSIGGNSAQGVIQVGEYLTKKIVGQPASHAGDEALKAQTRKLGLLYIETGEESKQTADALAAIVDKAGSPFAAMVAYTLDPATLQEQAAGAISKLKEAGVTSVVFSGDPVAPRDFTKEATAQKWFPEWIITGSALVDTTAFARTYDQQQLAHTFGLSFLTARGDPSTLGAGFLYKWFTGTEPPADGSVGLIQPNPGLFFTTIQAVGPNLTAETFKDALFAGDPPTKTSITAPVITYGDKGLWPKTDYLGIDDATEVWWNATATGPDEIKRDGTGMWAYVDGGKRYLPGTWPSSPSRAFDPEGSVTLYTTRPEGEQPPDYPSPAGG